MNAAAPNHRRQCHDGMTLIELLTVMAIIAILAGLLAVVYRYAMIKTRTNATKELITRIERAVANYQTQRINNYSLPIVEGGNPNEQSDEPGYYIMESAPLGEKSNGRESNQAFVTLLRKKLNVFLESKYLRDGELVDAFGNPVVIRFLRKLQDPKDPDGPMIRKVFIWTYGHDGINGINATPDYLNKGAPDYDREEIDRLTESDDQTDDVCSWRD